MRDPLEVAIAAAKRAGERLRAELHREGGPRGEEAKAEIDVDLERELRAFLLDAFPDDGFQGEETSPDEPRERAYWCVDPNDGTRSFVRGERRFAVSIARIVDGVPTLGVVYAPCFPDDRGDLLAWSEGGPLLRDGVPVTPVHATGAHAIVALPRGAERAARSALEAIAPARFQPISCTSYRLALVAAGDVDAAITLRRPKAWDIAGAHALLRGAGIDLAVRYAPFFAPKRIVVGMPELALRAWDAVRAARLDPPSDAPFVLPRTPERGASIADPELLSRAQGSLLGLLCGDNLGQRVEFRSSVEIAARHPEGVRDLVDGGTWNLMAGQPTDDGELALLLARAIDHDGFPKAETILEAYRAWLPDAFDVGATIGRALRTGPDATSQANGSLMRIAPIGIFGHALGNDAVAELARAESARTHAHPIPADACAVFCVAIAHALRTGDRPAEVFAATRAWARGRVVDSVYEDLLLAERELPEDFQTHQGWVRIAFRNAFFRLIHARSIEDGVVDTVHCGGDTDTNAAIAGALLGAVHGRSALPRRWLRLVLTCRPLEALAPTENPRPRVYWPTDALVLAERLLIAGRAYAGSSAR
ncbi:MAG: inositol monophosphatase family protein [Polyangiales bacterium]